MAPNFGEDTTTSDLVNNKSTMAHNKDKVERMMRKREKDETRETGG